MRESHAVDEGGACINCGSPRLVSRFENIAGVKSGVYCIVQCEQCALAFILTREPEHVDYSDYGDHIATQDESYYAARVGRVSFPKRRLFRYLMKRYGADASILDFGGGAGFFVRSALNFGFRHAYLVEPSLKLRAIATEKLHLEADKVAADIAAFGAQMDVVAMLDVIEHLPVDIFEELMRGIVQHMKPGAILLGTTPNFNSLNIALAGDKDPVIAPPQHTIYFTKASLDSCLRRLGLRRKLLLATGFSTNAFFRTKKFSPSWVERPSGGQKPIALAIRLFFAAIGAVLTALDKGYDMYFVYEKPRDVRVG
jgi:2-polyprenyl-3-methyl-5-hydroxy-6-metoxy-1,4-benzoquinol methylase